MSTSYFSYSCSPLSNPAYPFYLSFVMSLSTIFLSFFVNVNSPSRSIIFRLFFFDFVCITTLKYYPINKIIFFFKLWISFSSFQEVLNNKNSTPTPTKVIWFSFVRIMLLKCVLMCSNIACIFLIYWNEKNEENKKNEENGGCKR